MSLVKKIKVLIVDDSLLFREVLAKGIASDPEIEVVSRAVDPFDARDKILAFNPDVMTCDVQMPKMDGIEFIRRLLPQYPLPVIVVSTISEAVLDALNAGAVDFVSKPDIRSPKDIEGFLYDLIAKIKVAAKAKVKHVPEKMITRQEINKNLKVDFNKIIAIGASTGGTEAVYNLLKHFPAAMPAILVVQHIPPVFSRMFAERLNTQTAFHVKEAENGDYLEPGKVFIAPGDSHMKIKKIGERYKIEVFHGNKVNGHCPSVDVLFESVAKECGKNSIGIILTGMGYDGAKGLLLMKRAGARTIGQDERTSVVYGMPKIAWEIGAVEKQVSLELMPRTLLNALY